MSDFFELPRPKPNANLQTLDIKQLGLGDANIINQTSPRQEQPNPEIIAFSENNDEEPDLQLEKGSNLENDDDKGFSEKDTFHESMHREPARKALDIIEENIQMIRQESLQTGSRPGSDKKNATAVSQTPKKTTQVSKKIQNIIDFGENDLGEVGEWVEKSANCNGVSDDPEEKDPDFDEVFEPSGRNDLPNSKETPQKPQASNSRPLNVEKFGIGTASVKKPNGGYMMNNLKDKAKSMLLAQGVPVKRDPTEEEKPLAIVPEKPILSENLREKAEEEKKDLPALEENLEHYNDNDWEEISKRNLEKLNLSNIRMQSEEDVIPIYFPELWQSIKTLDLSKEKRNIVTSHLDELSFFQRLIFSCTATKLPPNLLLERDQIFAYAKVSFDDKNPLHFRMLSTIYRKLTDGKRCVRYGEHWEQIGFQGRDPATDLRGVGMLGILQIIAFISLNFEFIKFVYAYSQDQTYHFPLAVGLLNMTQVMLEALREARLHNVILHQKSVINAVNAFYFAVFFKFFMVYKANKCTESDFGELKKTIAELAKKNPGKLIADFIKEKEVFCKTIA